MAIRIKTKSVDWASAISKTPIVFLRSILICVGLILLGCSPPTTAPDWIDTPPRSNSYWYGVGVVSEPLTGEHRETARLRALDEIASQISVNISSSMLDVLVELNYNVSEYAESITKSRVDQNLQNVEFVDTYESGGKFYFLAKLSKKKYYDSVNEYRRNAIETALGYLERTRLLMGVDSFMNLWNAWKEIGPYLDNPIEVEFPARSGNKVNLYSTLKLTFADLVRQHELIPSVEQINVKVFVNEEKNFSIRCLDRNSGKPVANLPIVAEVIPEGSKLKSVTNVEGNAVFRLGTIMNKTRNQVISAGLDLVTLLDSSVVALAPSGQAKVQIKLMLQGPNVFVRSTELNLGKNLVTPVVAPVLKEFCVRELAAVFTAQGDSDILVDIIVNTNAESDEPNEWGIYLAYADASIEFIDSRSGNQIYAKSITGIRGGDFKSVRKAGEKAIANLSEDLYNNALPEIIGAFHE